MQIQFRFNDFDILGHVNNSIYQNYFDLARTAYFKDVLSDPINWRETSFVLAKITIEYFNPIEGNEPCVVNTKISKVGNKSITMTQQIINESDGQIKTTNEAILVSFDYSKGVAVEIPNQWRQEFISYEKDI